MSPEVTFSDITVVTIFCLSPPPPWLAYVIAAYNAWLRQRRLRNVQPTTYLHRVVTIHNVSFLVYEKTLRCTWPLVNKAMSVQTVSDGAFPRCATSINVMN